MDDDTPANRFDEWAKAIVATDDRDEAMAITREIFDEGRRVQQEVERLKASA